MMTRKHYIAVADIIKTVFCENENVLTNEALVMLVEKFCCLFEEDNPNFDRLRFIKACYGIK